MHKLIISDDEGKTTVVPLVRDEITIGRKEGNTIRLTERNVSRRHARLVRANGSFQIEDLGSYNGIRLNGVRIADKSSVKEGDQIQIGDYQLALQSDKAIAKPPAEEAVTVATAVPEATAPAAADAATELIPVPMEETIPMEAPRTTQSARLVLVSAPAPGQEFQLARDEMVIGRAEDCDVSINHRSMSREHAKILRVDQAYRVLDLESANGVRVNGQDVPYAELRRGDVIELGHVRLRFVAPGEIYRFDGDATIQMSAGVGFGRSSRAPIWVLAAALLLAGGVALYLASRPLDPLTPPPPPSPSAVPAVPPRLPNPEPPVNVAALLDQARQALRDGDYRKALDAASQAHSQERGNAEAEQLVHEITRLMEAADHFDSGRAKRDAGDEEGAYAEFDRIPPGTAQYDDPQVVDLMERVLEARLAQARQALGRSELDSARQLATSITDAQRAAGDTAPAKLVAVRTRAETLLRTIEERERIALANAVRDPVQEQQEQQRQQQRQQELREQQRQQQQQVREQQRLQEQREQEQRERELLLQREREQREREQTQTAGNARDCGPIVSVSAARCFLDASGGNASGEYMLRNLILAHTLLGDRGRARPLASRYFEQYGSSPFARQIRQLGYSP